MWKPAPAERRAPLNTETTLIPETDHEETTDSDVSDPALHYAEQETVPYNDPLKERRCSNASESSGEQPLASSTGLDKEAESKEGNCQNNPDHEAPQVLQDIFFSWNWNKTAEGICLFCTKTDELLIHWQHQINPLFKAFTQCLVLPQGSVSAKEGCKQKIYRDE